MTTRMYYPHQQAVARHPEKQKKKLLSTYFSKEAVSKFLFDTASDVCKNQYSAILYSPCY